MRAAATLRSDTSSSARRIETASIPAMLTATVKSKAGARLVEVFAPALESSLERAHIPGPQPTGHGEFHPGGEHASDVHGDERIHGVKAGQQHDQRGAGAFPEAIGTHVHHRLGRPLGCLGQRRVEELVAGPED